MRPNYPTQSPVAVAIAAAAAAAAAEATANAIGILPTGIPSRFETVYPRVVTSLTAAVTVANAANAATNSRSARTEVVSKPTVAMSNNAVSGVNEDDDDMYVAFSLRGAPSLTSRVVMY